MRRGGPTFADITSFSALHAAALRASRGLAGRPAVARFLVDLEPELLALQRELHAGEYQPRPLRHFRIRDPKPRTISVAHFRDRVVHHALCAGIEPRLERYADPNSYACRVGKGNRAAVLRVQQLARKRPWFVKLDVRHFFETADHAVLRNLLRRLIRDRDVLGLAGTIIAAGGHEPGKGLPIGNLTSQHFGNLYLSAFDHRARVLPDHAGLVRYMDDIVLFAESRDAARRLRDGATLVLEDELRLEVKQEATRLAPTSNGVPMLGFRVWPRLIRLDGARARRVTRRHRRIRRALRDGHVTEADAARRMQGLFAWTDLAASDGLRWPRQRAVEPPTG
jgi:hypothetical protein